MYNYEEIFLDKNDYLKYQVYAKLARQDVHDVSVMDISTLLGWRYQQTYNVIHELLDDLQPLCGLARSKLRRQVLAGQLPLSLERYRGMLASQSLPYQLLMASLQPSPSLTTFSHDYFVSESTISRRLRPARALMHDAFGITFRTAQMRFIGPEANVRYFLYTMLWWAHRGTSWPLDNVVRDDIDACLAAWGITSIGPLCRAQDRLFLGVSRARMGHALADNPVLQAVAKMAGFQGRDAMTAAFVYSFVRCRLQFGPAEPLATRLPASVQAQVAALLAVYRADPHTAPAPGTLAPNLARLCLAAQVYGRLPPQPSDYLQGASPACDAGLKAACARVLGAGQEALTTAVAALMTPGIRPQAAVAVKLAVPPEAPGAEALKEFIGAVPTVAQVTANNTDLVVGIDAPVANCGGDCGWFEDALEIPIYRQRLMQSLLASHAAKMSSNG